VQSACHRVPALFLPLSPEAFPGLLVAAQAQKDRLSQLSVGRIARDAATKMEGDVKVGTKVTIDYRITATTVEAKETKGAARASPKKAK
jgi:hypothetical protein